jgi:hypothetical protein
LLPYTSFTNGAGCLELDPVGGTLHQNAKDTNLYAINAPFPRLGDTPGPAGDGSGLIIGISVAVAAVALIAFIAIIACFLRRRASRISSVAQLKNMMPEGQVMASKHDKRESIVTATMAGPQPTPQQYPYPVQGQPQQAAYSPNQQYPYPVQQQQQQPQMQPMQQMQPQQQGAYPQGYQPQPDPQMGYSPPPQPVVVTAETPMAAPAQSSSSSSSSSSDSESDSEKQPIAPPSYETAAVTVDDDGFASILIEKMRKNPTLGSRYIDYNQLEFERQLGKGNFGAVFYGIWNGQPVAIKKSNMVVASKKDIEDIIREAETMLSFPPHPNVLSVLGISYHDTDFFIISEYCSEGSLDKHFGKGDLTFERRMKLIHEIALGVAHIHKYGIVHRDLAARNVLLDGEFRGKVCDFGMSRQLTAQDDSLKTQSVVGPLKYMAPEVRFRPSLKRPPCSFL